MEKEIVMTYAGLRALEDELEQLKTVKRKEVAEKIKVARGYGDLSENSEYRLRRGRYRRRRLCFPER